MKLSDCAVEMSDEIFLDMFEHVDITGNVSVHESVSAYLLSRIVVFVVRRRCLEVL